MNRDVQNESKPSEAVYSNYSDYDRVLGYCSSEAFFRLEQR